MLHNFLCSIVRKILFVIGWFFLVEFCCCAPICVVLGPAFLISGLLGLFIAEDVVKSSNMIIMGLILSCLGIIFIYSIKKNKNPFVWLEEHFLDDTRKEESRSIQKADIPKTSSFSSTKSSNSKGLRTQSFRNYVDKEANEIIKNNNITSNEDKSAANLLAINNIKHSPEAISNIYNIPIEKAKEVEENITIEEEKKVSNHVSYEGRISTSDKNKMKSILGYKCAACGKDMSEIYGNIGHNYIELHHKVPYSEMKEDETRTLTENEFCVLCPDCHRMIHKLPDASDIDMLVRIIKLNKKD